MNYRQVYLSPLKDLHKPITKKRYVKPNLLLIAADETTKLKKNQIIWKMATDEVLVFLA